MKWIIVMQLAFMTPEPLDNKVFESEAQCLAHLNNEVPAALRTSFNLKCVKK